MNQRNSNNGKEFVEMHGLDEYDSEARWYYPQLMRTTTMDPLCEKYYSLSPYSWCANNPVRMVDHDGRFFDDTNEAIASQTENELIAKRNEYNAQLEKIGSLLGEDSEEYSKIQTSISEINKSIRDIYKMRHDQKYEYRFEKGGDETTSGLAEDGHPCIVMRYNSQETQIHEIRHGGQFARRQMRVGLDGNTKGYGVSKEIDAFRAQLAYMGCLNLPVHELGAMQYSVREIFYYSTINRSLIKRIYDIKTNTYVYPPTGMSKILWNIH